MHRDVERHMLIEIESHSKKFVGGSMYERLVCISHLQCRMHMWCIVVLEVTSSLKFEEGGMKKKLY